MTSIVVVYGAAIEHHQSLMMKTPDWCVETVVVKFYQMLHGLKHNHGRELVYI